MMEKVAAGPVDWNIAEQELGLDQKMWRKRTIALRKFICEEDKSVLDIGAGRMYLRQILPEETQYYPLDYTKRCADTLVCDLNQYEFPDIRVDAAVCAGILEYIKDAGWFFDQLKACTKKIALSYKGKEGGFERSQYTTDEVIRMLYARGFILTQWDQEFKDEWPLLACFEKISPQLLGRNYFCTGCGACESACPVSALYMEPDKFGFFKPGIDLHKCINCGRCAEVCPAARPVQKDDAVSDGCGCYAAWAADEVREKSSSGGAFTVFAANVLQHHGVVYGAQYTEDFCVQHTGIRDSSKLDQLRHSKYVQSSTAGTFQEAGTELEKGSMVLYTGTPCQIAGLKSFLGKEYRNLITIDLICFCVPAISAFRKYLEESYGIENISKVVFRDKYRGWTPDGYTVHKKDGTVRRADMHTDDFQKAFHAVLCRNAACENCRYAGFPREGDLTIGDFWGIGCHDESWDDHKGTSLVLVNSGKGKHFLDSVCDQFQRIQQVPVEWCRGKGNRIGNDGRSGHRNADRFMGLLKKEKFHDAVEYMLESRRDIGIVCQHGNNYGNNLTNYALYQTVRDLGYSAVLIEQAQDAQWKPYEKKLGLFAHIPYEEGDLLPGCKDKMELKKFNQVCGMFMTASDQLFRAVFVEGMDFHSCLDWVAPDKYKMSYAASFGTDIFEGTSALKGKMQYFLNRFQAVSVREDTGVRILEEEFGIQGQLVADPVFLCDKKYFLQMAGYGKLRLPNVPYAGGYILDPSGEKEAVIDAVCRQRGGLAHVVIRDGEADRQKAESDWGLQFLSDALVEEWLANILYSDIFITDSFHGLCFALIFQKDFFVVSEDGNWRGRTRLESLLGRLGLEDRLLRSIRDLHAGKINEHIDYGSVDARLQQMISGSREWLIRQLEKGLNFCGGGWKSYDILGREIDAARQDIYEVQDRIEKMNGRQEQLQQQYQAAAAQNRELEERLQLLLGEHRELQKQQEDGRRYSVELERRAADLHRELTAVYASSSWRVTSIFRTVKTVSGKLFGSRRQR